MIFKKKIKITDNEFVGFDEISGDFYKCPNCKEDFLLVWFKYCPICGKKLKWKV